MYTHSQTLDVTYFHTHQRKTFEYRNTPIDWTEIDLNTDNAQK